MRIQWITVGVVLALLAGWAWLQSPRPVGGEGSIPREEVRAFDGSEARALGEPSRAEVELARRASSSLEPDEASDDLGGPALRGRVVDTLGAPLSAAQVFVHLGRGVLTRTRIRLTTDGTGRFACRGWALAGLQGERVRLTVTHDQHAPASFERAWPRLEAELELGALVVAEGGQVSGRVVDLAGHPVPGATVRLLAGEDRLSGLAAEGRASDAAMSTEHDGSYCLRHVAVGAWRIVATAPLHVQATSREFRVEDGEHTAVAELELGPGLRLEGLVLDASRRPVPGASVNLRPRRGVGFRTATDPTGFFTLDHLPAGPALLAVVADGYLRFQQDDFDPRAVPGLLSVTLTDGLTLAVVALDAEQGVPVRHFAAHASRIGDLPQRVTRPASETGFTVPLSGPLFGNDLGQPEDHPSGRCSWVGLREGVYRIELQSPEHTRWRSPPIELRAGASPVVRAVLEHGRTLVGRVRAAPGRPVAAPRIALRAADRDPGKTTAAQAGLAKGPLLLAAQTDHGGGFVLAHVPEGRFRVVASARGHASARSDAFDPGAAAEALELTLGPLGTIEGVVRGTLPSRATSVTVVALGAGPSLAATLQEDGAYRIEDVPPGAYAVRATLGGVEDAWRRFGAGLLAGGLAADISLVGGETVRFDPAFEPPENGSVSGSVTLGDRPGVGLWLELTPAPDRAPGAVSGRGRARVTLGPSGGFTLADVQPGEYELRVHGGEGNDQLLARQALSVFSRQQAEIHLQVGAGAARR